MTAHIPRAMLDAIYCRRMIGFSLIEADAIRTSNYAEASYPAYNNTGTYALEDRVTSSSNIYRCIKAGTAPGGSGPSGTDPTVAESIGPCKWQYIGPVSDPIP